MPKIQAETFLLDTPEKVLRAPAILIAGDESYLIDKVLAVALERLVDAPGADQFDIDRRNAADLDSASYNALVETPPLLNGRRIVVLRGVGELAADVRDEVKRTLTEAPQSLCLVGTGAAAMRGNLYKMWEKHGARIVCELPRKSPRSKSTNFDFSTWLAGRAKADFGKKLDREAAQTLAELGEELQSLYNELEKVCLYVGDDQRVTRADVEAVCIGGTLGSVWEWCDAVADRRVDDALGMLEDLLAQGETAYRLVPLLATHFLRLGVVVEMDSRDPQAIMEALPGRSWYAMASKLAAQAKHHSPQSVASTLDALTEADRMLKSTNHREEFVLHRHLLEVLDVA